MRDRVWRSVLMRENATTSNFLIEAMSAFFCRQAECPDKQSEGNANREKETLL
jgi:hypothetical protein